MKTPNKVVLIDYTNWRGERSIRRILPLELSWGFNEWHPQTQWLLSAVDMEKGEIREFCCQQIHSWTPEA